MFGTKWSEEEIENVKKMYEYSSKNDILTALPRRNWEMIVRKASDFGLKRKIPNPKLNNSIEKLLEETHEAYYWAGFIAADGCFSKKFEIRIGLSTKDLEHLNKYAVYIGSKVHHHKTKPNAYVGAKNKHIVPLIMNKFDLNIRKTYNPPKTIKWINKEFILSFIIGFFDGDGYIRGKNGLASISILSHSSWTHILKEISEILSEFFNIKVNPPTINGRGYANLSIGRFQVVKGLKLHCIKHNLPVLNRKWNIVDENKECQFEKTNRDIKTCYELKKQGLTSTEIAKKTGIDYERVRLVGHKIKDGKYHFNNGFEPLILE